MWTEADWHIITLEDKTNYLYGWGCKNHAKWFTVWFPVINNEMKIKSSMSNKYKKRKTSNNKIKNNYMLKMCSEKQR